MKVIVAHPERQHSFFTATALEQEGMLFKYITTVYNKQGSLTNLFGKLLKGNDKKKADSRYCSNIPDEKVMQCLEISALISLILIRLPHCKPLYRKWRRFVNHRFAKKVASYAIENNVDAVISYDFCSDELFDILKKEAPHIIRVLDVSISNRAFMKTNYEKDMERTGDDRIKAEQIDLWDEAVIDSVVREIHSADYFLVPSQIVKKSLEFSGADPEKIKIIPYGVDTSKFEFVRKKTVNKPLHLIYVGQISFRKGLHHLLKVVSQYSPDQIKLTVAGAYTADSVFVKEYGNKENIEFAGFVTRDVLAKKYQESDAFIFPTLGEGYGLVVLEALSCGVPVISSDLAGGNDAITEGYNGYVFEAGNDEEMIKKIGQLAALGTDIEKMSENARESALGHTWEKYYSDVRNAIKEFAANK